MKWKNALALAACWLAVAAVAADMEIRWHLGDGSTEIEHREMEERDGVSVFALARSEIVARKASSVELTPDFARAKKGDKGFWVVSSGETGTFRCDDGKLAGSRDFSSSGSCAAMLP